MMCVRSQGRISEWRDEQGFGFITPDEGGPKVFVHINAFTSRGRRPVGNEIVTYRAGADERGRPRAEAVEYLRSNRPASTRWGPSYLLLSLAALFLGGLVGLHAYGKAPDWVLYCYLGMSVVTFSLYAIDKSAAQDGRWRTQENTLQVFALLGGWPGALIAQQLLRHKSRKRSFQVVFWMLVVVNSAVLSWILSDNVRMFVAKLVGEFPL